MKYTILMTLMALLQFGTSFDLFRQHKNGMAVAFFAYGVSTIALMYDASH